MPAQVELAAFAVELPHSVILLLTFTQSCSIDYLVLVLCIGIFNARINKKVQ